MCKNVHPTTVINNAGCTFLPFNLISPPYTTSYHFSSYLAYWPNICLELDHKLFFTFGHNFFGAMHFENMVRPALLITLGAPYFQVLCDGLLLYGQTTAISKSRYYAWKICKIWWKVIAGRIWWWDEILWQNCAPSVIDNVGCIPKNATVKILLRRIF